MSYALPVAPLPHCFPLLYGFHLLGMELFKFSIYYSGLDVRFQVYFFEVKSLSDIKFLHFWARYQSEFRETRRRTVTVGKKSKDGNKNCTR